MPHYSYLLFDADNTLFDFDAANRNAFHAVCRQCDIPDTDETFALYERCNNAMWAAFDRGECTKDFLVVERFRHFLETMALDRDPALCNRIHLTALGESTLLLSHAEEACRTLSRTHRLYIVTNAVASVQRSRLHRSAVAPYITDAFISEDAGASKPSRAYFDYVFAHIPGIKVVAPSNPYDAKMVLKAAIECDDPVLYFENKILYKEKGEVPEIGEEEPYTLGKARVEREGKDVTIVSYSIGMKNARGAADLLAKEGIEAEVIDLITLSPWDKETVLNSVKKTHRLCIVHEAVKQGGFGAEISATVAEEAMEYLDAPILRYGAPFCPIPFAPTLEKMVKVVPEDLVKGIKGMF